MLFVMGVMFAIISPAGVAQAEETSPDIELRHDLRIDLPVTLALSGGLIAYTAVGRDHVLSSRCNWCDGGRPDGVNDVDTFFRDAFLRRDTHAASITSHIVSYGAAPLLTTALVGLAGWDEGKTKNFPVDALIVAEATITAVSISEVVKAFVLRERPNVHSIADHDEHIAEGAKSGANLSFPSGHTLAIMALTASAGTVAGMRRYRITPVIWVTGTMLTLAAGYLRIAADQHYFTDTLAGAAMGLGVGAGVPLLFHAPTNPLRNAAVHTDGRSLNLTFTF